METLEELRTQLFATKGALLAGNLKNPVKAMVDIKKLERKITTLENKELTDLIDA